MQDSFDNSLLDMFQYDFLEDMLTKFTDATGVKTLLVDYQGKSILWPRISAMQSQLCSFCAAVRGLEHLERECERCDAFSGIIVSQTEKPLIYRCYMGNVEVSVPIKVNGQYLGTIKLGQIVLPPEEREQIDYLYPPTISLDDYPDLKKLSEVEDRLLVPYEKLRALADLLHFLANYVAQIAFSQIFSKKIEQLNDRIAQEERRNCDTQKMLSQAKTELAQKNINQSLLLNTLDILNNLILLEENQRALKVISILSEILRQGVYYSDYLTDLGSEYAFMQQHLLIYQMASEGRIQVTTSADQACLNATIPSLSLQPLVESTIHNGLIPNGYSGNVTIDLGMADDMVQIVYTNDGVCLPSHLLSNLQDVRSMRRFVNEGPTSLSFTFLILSQYFGDAASWDIVSSPKAGTTVSIRIPHRPFEKSHETKA